MSENRPFVLTIAGFDPSAGAGILADIKTFEQLKTYGIAIPTAYTIQTENQFVEMEWVTIEKVLFQIELFLKAYKIKAIKITSKGLGNITEIDVESAAANVGGG